MKFLFLLALVALLGFFSCTENNASEVIVPRDTTITPKNAITDLFLDSTTLEAFISNEGSADSTASLMRNFYKSRNYQYAWFTSKGLDQHGYAFWNLYNHYINYNRDSSLHSDTLQKLMQEFMQGDSVNLPPRPTILQTELQLTEHFLVYAHHAFNGKIDPEEFKWFIPRKKIDALALLDSMITLKGKNVDEWAPVNSMYLKIRDQLQQYYELEKNEDLPRVGSIEKALRKGDSAAIIIPIKKHLHAYGDLAENDSTTQFDETLEEAVKHFQKRMGLKQDGVIGKDFSKEINVSLQSRVEQLLVNMERMRWLPPQPKGTYIVANIPSFRIMVMEGAQVGLQMDIVVGKEGTNTVIFTDSLKYVVFSPYWNVPNSIVRNEIAPILQRDPGYISRNNMEITGYSNGLPIVRQKPGGSNALGLVKFIFPNNYNIYFHDTPSKHLFDRDKRAFSHGCIRLRDAEKMANYLLQHQPEWTPEKINAAMHSGEEKWVSLKTPLPVFITYFTAWVDEDNLLHFREDIYGHDKKLADRLFHR